MERSQIPPLQSLHLGSRPLGTHALAWSCDAELAVACGDVIELFLPAYPPPPTRLLTVPNRGGGGGGGNPGLQQQRDIPQPQFSTALRALAIIQANPAINAELCAFSGVTLPPIVGVVEGQPARFPGVGSGDVTRQGGAVCQVVRVEWSPSGVGFNLRPVLLAMLTNGCLVAFGEVSPSSVSGKGSGARARSFRNWRMLWGLGGSLPLPKADEEGGYKAMDERVASFSWAKQISPGCALLAYLNGQHEIVIMTVQYLVREKTKDQASVREESGWVIEEVARFDSQGPHEVLDQDDPSFVPCGTAHALNWSPWESNAGSRTATLSYISNHSIGFRRITLSGNWTAGGKPAVVVAEADTSTLCMPLFPDAFVEWEDVTWNQDGVVMARGVVGTPSEVKPFHVPLTGGISGPAARHSVNDCGAVLEPAQSTQTNPIAGLVLHNPDPTNSSSSPYYTAVRLSATGTNPDWHETKLPLEAQSPPQWVERVRKATNHLVPRGTVIDDLETSSSEEDAADEDMDEGSASRLKVRAYRFRIWGLASSPGGGCFALLVTKHSNLHPSRRGRCTVYFSRAKEATVRRIYSPEKMTTEGQVWEWMYGGLEGVPGVTDRTSDTPVVTHSLRDVFRDIVPQQTCVFCDAAMLHQETSARCENGHLFAICPTSGFAIMTPGGSRTCAVCGLQCLSMAELTTLAHQHGKRVEDHTLSTGGGCGGCGGKFLT